MRSSTRPTAHKADRQTNARIIHTGEEGGFYSVWFLHCVWDNALFNFEEETRE